MKVLVAVAEDCDEEFDARDYLFVCMQGCHHTLLLLLLLHLLPSLVMLMLVQPSLSSWFSSACPAVLIIPIQTYPVCSP